MLTGMVIGYTGTDTPSGYLECDGGAVSRATYADLFAVLGTTWGAGDGVSTFNLPDLRGRAMIGVGTGPTLTNRPLGTIGGAERVQLSVGHLPPHKHRPAGDAVLRYVGSGGTHNVPLTAGSEVVLDLDFPNVGNNDLHDNMSPYAALRMLIKA
jgi:microcystin-dependent protein